MSKPKAIVRLGRAAVKVERRPVEESGGPW